LAVSDASVAGVASGDLAFAGTEGVGAVISDP
jgi:hypothetical protein